MLRFAQRQPTDRLAGSAEANSKSRVTIVRKKYPTIEAACFGVAVVFDFDLPPFETM